MKVDMSAEAVTQRLKLTSQLRRLAISLAHDRMDWSKIAFFKEDEDEVGDLSNEEHGFQKGSTKS